MPRVQLQGPIMKDHCHVDFETRSTVDLKKSGAHVYAKGEHTDALCLAYAFGNEKVNLWKLGEPLPERLKEAMLDPSVIFAAHNAQFEFLIFNLCCHKKYGWPLLPIERFDCTMIRAYNMGLPGSLDMASKAVGLKHEKDAKGHRIMMQLCKPRAYSYDGQPIWWDANDTSGALDIASKYEHLYRYCIQDIIVERALDQRLLQLSPSEKELWHLDQKINFRGVYCDIPIAARAIDIVATEKKALDKRMRLLTGGRVNTCNSHVPLKEWINDQAIEYDESVDFANEAIWDGDVLVVEGVAKDVVNDLLERDDIAHHVRDVLELRKEAAKNSVAKLKAMILGADKDFRLRGLLQFYGAASTGRWAGRRVQTQNMTRPELKQAAIDDIFEYFENERNDEKVYNYISVFHGKVVPAISDCLRGMICAAPGKKLIACDWAAIEGRMLAWLAGQESALNIYRTHGMIYEATACDIYGLPRLDDVTKKQRLVGKVATLALGYQGGKRAFHSMAKNYFLRVPDEQAEDIKKKWRLANPQTVAYWYDLERAAVSAINSPGQKFAVGPRGRQVIFMQKGSFLFCLLPSGRPICYPYPKMRNVIPPWEREKKALDPNYKIEPKLALTYMGLVNQKWVRRAAYGGLLAENITQATSRDVLAEGLHRVENAGYPIVMHTHDEIVCEVPEGFGSAKELENLMCILPKWANGLPVDAEAWEGKRYRK